MFPEQDEFYQMLERVRAGKDGAVRELLERYGPHIQAVIRQKLDVGLRSVFDSLDFLQDVWASFFAGDLEHTFRDAAALMRFLASMARNKVTDEMRKRLGGRKCNMSREYSLDGSARGVAASLCADEPAPGDRAVANEEWARLLEGRPFHHQRILQLLRQGYTHEEIALELGLNKKTVSRLIQKLVSRPRT